MLTAVVSLSLRSVCVPEVAGANETGFGVRHEQRGTGGATASRGSAACSATDRRSLTTPPTTGTAVDAAGAVGECAYVARSDGATPPGPASSSARLSAVRSTAAISSPKAASVIRPRSRSRRAVSSVRSFSRRGSRASIMVRLRGRGRLRCLAQGRMGWRPKEVIPVTFQPKSWRLRRPFVERVGDSHGSRRVIPRLAPLARNDITRSE